MGFLEVGMGEIVKKQVYRKYGPDKIVRSWVSK
jgi:hypothetical protein